MSRKLTFIVPGEPDQPTGGYRFDQRVCTELRKRGWVVDLVGLPGRFPLVDETARQAMAATLAGLADGAAVVVDGLAMGGLPEVLAENTARLDITALVHHPLADETGLSPQNRRRLHQLETRALASARRIIVTSRFTADRLAQLHMMPGMTTSDPTAAPAATNVCVAEPGVDIAAPGQRVQARLDGREQHCEHLLCVASLVPRKGHRFLVEALAGLVEYDWQCTLAGPRDRDPACAQAVETAIRQFGLDGRVTLTGALAQPALDRLYGRAGLLVLPSLFEGYGMVVTEALAHGVPILTTDAGALAFTAPESASMRVPAGDSAALGTALKSWFDDAELRHELTRGAIEQRARLPSWKQTCNAFAAALDTPA